MFKMVLVTILFSSLISFGASENPSVETPKTEVDFTLENETTDFHGSCSAYQIPEGTLCCSVSCSEGKSAICIGGVYCHVATCRCE